MGDEGRKRKAEGVKYYMKNRYGGRHLEIEIRQKERGESGKRDEGMEKDCKVI